MTLYTNYQQRARGMYSTNSIVSDHPPQFSLYDAADAEHHVTEPTCIVFPQSTADVVAAMSAIYQADSNYAVRGGGHSAMPGWNT